MKSTYAFYFVFCVGILGLNSNAFAQLKSASPATLEEYISADPKMAGFKSIKSNYPAIWEELENRLQRLRPDETPFSVVSSFLSEKLPVFSKDASDETLFEMEALMLRKLEYLKESNPRVCGELGAGRLRYSPKNFLSEELLKEEAKMLSKLVNEQSGPNSGVADWKEASDIMLSNWIYLEDNYYDQYVALLTANGGFHADPLKVCNAIINFKLALKEHDKTTVARYMRSPVHLSITPELHPDAHREITFRSLRSELKEFNNELPVRVDDKTILATIDVDRKGVIFNYTSALDVPDKKAFKAKHGPQIMRNICRNPEFGYVLESGMVIAYTYDFQDGNAIKVTASEQDCR